MRWIGICLGVLWSQVYQPIIWRDSLGIAHIYGQTDAEVAYGLGYVQAEDVGIYLQESFLAGRGLLSKVRGRAGALWDFMRVWTGTDTVKLEPYFSPAVWQLLEAFAAGVNAYYADHPGERLLPEAFPATADDVARGSFLILHLMGGLGTLLPFMQRGILSELGEIFNGIGSNAWAIAPHRMADSSTWLLVNSHQPLEGRFAWYEAEIHSAEGWHFRGGYFPGSPVPHLGCNPALGWAHTMNYSLTQDVYQLTVRGRRYRVYGENAWRRFAKTSVRLHLKGLPFPIRKRIYSTIWGAAIKFNRQWYAVSPWKPQRLHPIEAWYRLSKARNLTAFRAVLSGNALPAFHTVYADEEGHIGLFSTFHLPQRDPKLSWAIPITEPTPDHIHRDWVPFSELPHVIDPPCGYVYNANQTPLAATCPPANPKPDRPLIGLQHFTYNRGERLVELWQRYEGHLFTFEDLKAIKHDRCYAAEGSYRRVFAPLFALKATQYPDLRDEILAIHNWQGCAEPQDTVTALLMLTHHLLEKAMGLRFSVQLIIGWQPTPQEVVKALRTAKKTLLKRYGTAFPRWQEVLRHGRGGVEVGLGGAPEVLEARHLAWEPKRAVFYVKGGDGLTYFIGWRQGRQTIWTIQPYGASHNPKSPHYADQIQGFAKQQYLETHLTSGPPKP